MIEIIGTNGDYLISRDGDVFSVKRKKMLKQYNFSNGYKSVCIKRFGKTNHVTIHRLIAEHFIPNPENKKVVNHLNGIKDDNRVENLQWSTYSENNKHAFDIGLNKAVVGSKRHTSTINEDMVLLIRDLYKTKKMKEISTELNLGYDLVYQVCKRITWKHI